MDRPDRKNRSKAVKKHPKVPIKTYKWEDIRRARKKGGYPWTHLYKQPYDGHVDPEQFTMEAMRKSKSASTINKSESGVHIEEMSTSERKDSLATDEHSTRARLTPEPIITQEDSATEDMEVDPDTNRERPDIVAIESAESSDNISQYVDKENRLPSQTDLMKIKDIPGPSKEEAMAATNENGQRQRARSEEPKRKRKLSIESSYSRISLSKLGVMKKLKEAKEKIKSSKVAKIAFPTGAKRTKKNGKDKQKPVKSEVVKKQLIVKAPEKPVYIHIPLKPPPGETDEFSYLEFEEKKPASATQETAKDQQAKDQPATQTEDKAPPKPKLSFRSLGARVIQEAGKSSENIPADTKKESPVTSKPPIPPASTKSDTKPPSPAPKEDETEPKKPQETTTPSKDTEPSTSETKQTPPKPSEVKKQPSSSSDSDEPVATKIFYFPKASSSEREENDNELKVDTKRGVRAKSAEPERKRRRSVDSEYSRISLPKMSFFKKLKSTAEKIKFPKLSLSTLSLPGSKKQKDKNKEDKPQAQATKEKAPKKQTLQRPPKDEKPVYIHIPLKPPPGETDEFSHLAGETKKEIKQQESKESQDTPDTPKSSDSAQGNAVQFIILTAPSDDEVLDDRGVPDTPSSDQTQPFFDSKIEKELKQLAENVVDKFSPATKRKHLQTVGEDQEIDADEKVATQDKKEADAADEATEKQPESEVVAEKMDTTPEPKQAGNNREEVSKQAKAKIERIIVDEEDGLKSSEITKPEDSPVDDQEQKELKSALRSEEGSPILKKKVSFKRRSKGADGIYEDVKLKGEKKVEGTQDEVQDKAMLATLGTSQSMSVDEERSYLDEKLMKTTSLEEDYNKWSKLSDHDYEPVNPPPDDVAMHAPPSVHVIDTTGHISDRHLGDDDHYDNEPFTAEEMQSQIEDRYFSAARTASSTQSSQSSAGSPPTSTTTSSKTQQQSTRPEGPSKFQQALKIQADKLRTQKDRLKTKMQGIKKPNITLPNKPKFQKPNLQKFKISKPKVLENAKINLPSFTLPSRSKQTLKQRQFSTESNAGDSKNKHLLDFKTYPTRLFRRKSSAPLEFELEIDEPEFATVPRTNKSIKKAKETDRWGGRDVIRIPLHPEDSMELGDDEREDSVERRMASHTRYNDDIDIDDAFDKENREIHSASPFSSSYNSRWDHGSFHPDPNQDLGPDERYFDEPTEEMQLKKQEFNMNIKNQFARHGSEEDGDYKISDFDPPCELVRSHHESFDYNNGRDVHSSQSSLGMHRRGVLEEINSDEFFLRQKGISQDNIDVGKYLSSEIREAFRADKNALERFDDNRGSNQSLPEALNKKKPMKKPKRRKTPHVSEEQVRYQQESSIDETADLPPNRPKRRSKKKPKPRLPEVIPYQETIPAQHAEEIEGTTFQESLSPSVEREFNLTGKSDDERDIHYKAMYENERMTGKEHPTIQITDAYANFGYGETSYLDEIEAEEPPAPPPRRNKSRSLKSLTFSEHDSILGGFEQDKDIPSQNMEVYKTEHEYIIPIPDNETSPLLEQQKQLQEVKEPPKRPSRRPSRPSRSQSVTTSITDEDQVSRGISLTSDIQGFSEPQELEPCVEEPCAKVICDYMGYTVVDKSKCREPPLPPPRVAPRKKKGKKQGPGDSKFFTVPRASSGEPPIRPLRNYSTLGPSSRSSSSMGQAPSFTNEEKENILAQYIELDDEPNRNLQSGEVIQKMRERPLPAPPRPPRKTRPLRDITSQENIAAEFKDDLDETKNFDETEVSTQTEPLPDDFVCEEVVQEESDRVLTPTARPQERTTSSTPVEEISRVSSDEPLHRVKRLITPTHYTYEEETVTHGALVVEPLDGARILPDHQLTRNERTVPIRREDDDFSEVPEEFKRLRDPPARGDRSSERPSSRQSEVEFMKTQKLQVSDLDVDRLTVNELLASKIVVSEIDSNNIQTSEISSKGGALKVGEIELPPSMVQQLLERLQSHIQQETPVSGGVDADIKPSEEAPKSTEGGQKKNFD